MNFPQLYQSDRKWRGRRNQTTGCLITALNKINDEFQKSSSRVIESHRELHKIKAELLQYSSEVQKLEQELKQNTNDYRRIVETLEVEIQNITESQDALSFKEKVDISLAQSSISKTRKQINDIDRELNQKGIVSKPDDSNTNESSTSMATVPIRIELPDIDPTGIIKKEGHFKINNTAGKCCICLEHEIDSIFHQCGHHRCCLPCAKKIIENKQKCPVCRISPKRAIKMYF